MGTMGQSVCWELGIKDQTPGYNSSVEFSHQLLCFYRKQVPAQKLNMIASFTQRSCPTLFFLFLIFKSIISDFLFSKTLVMSQSARKPGYFFKISDIYISNHKMWETSGCQLHAEFLQVPSIFHGRSVHRGRGTHTLRLSMSHLKRNFVTSKYTKQRHSAT